VLVYGNFHFERSKQFTKMVVLTKMNKLAFIFKSINVSAKLNYTKLSITIFA